MNFDIALLLGQDGLTNGAIYALLALALVLVFAVTRVIFVPQGEFVAYGALTLASLELGGVPGTAWLLLAGGVVVTLAHVDRAREGRAAACRATLRLGRRSCPWRSSPRRGGRAARPGSRSQSLLALALVIPMGPMVYRLAFQPLADGSVLVLLIVAVGVHFAMIGLGLVFFGPEGSRTTPFTDARFEIGAAPVSGQSLFVIGACGGADRALYLFFERTLSGKALRATAVNRLGARLVGIAPTRRGSSLPLAAPSARCPAC